MTDSRRPYGAEQPEPIDDNEDRMGSMHELDFDEEPQSSIISDELPEHLRQQPVPRKPARSIDAGEVDDEETSDDELTPGNLIREDGARDAHDTGGDDPADWDLSIVGEGEIGGGNGLDEAELARRDPVGRKR